MKTHSFILKFDLGWIAVFVTFLPLLSLSLPDWYPSLQNWIVGLLIAFKCLGIMILLNWAYEGKNPPVSLSWKDIIKNVPVILTLFFLYLQGDTDGFFTLLLLASVVYFAMRMVYKKEME